MWRALLRSIWAVWLATLCVARDSALNMALKDLMQTKEFHELKAKITEKDRCSSSYYMHNVCNSNRLVCCKTSGEWIVRRGKLQRNTITVYPENQMPLLANSTGVRTHHKLTGITSTNMAFVSSAQPWPKGCREIVDGTLHIFGAWGTTNVFHLFNDVLLALTSQAILDAYLFPEEALLPRKYAMRGLTTGHVKHYEILDQLMGGEVADSEIADTCFRRVHVNTAIRLNYVDVLQPLRRQSADVMRSMAQHGWNMSIPAEFRAPAKTGALNVVVMTRGASGVRTLRNEHLIVEAFKQMGHRAALCCDFRAMSIAAQLAYPFHADVMVGIHGAGLMNALFMKKGGMLVELRSHYGFDTGLFIRVADSRSATYVAMDIRSFAPSAAHQYTIDGMKSTALANSILNVTSNLTNPSPSPFTYQQLSVLPSQPILKEDHHILGPHNIHSITAALCARSNIPHYSQSIGHKKVACASCEHDFPTITCR